MKSTVAQSVTARRGFLSLELAFTLPILAVVLFALFEFSLLFLARSKVVEAAHQGARLASRPAVNTNGVDTVDTLGTDGISEAVEWRIRRLLSPRLREAAVIDIHGGHHTGDIVTVSVTVPMHHAAPDLLWPIGYSLKGRSLHATSHMVKE